MGDLSIETKSVPTTTLSTVDTEIKDLKELKVGSGSSIFYTDKEGSRWGHQTFEEAKAWIKPSGLAKFTASDGTVLMNTGATDGNFLQIINTALNTSSKTILQGFTFGSSDYAGAFKTGNITWNEATGAITGGSGSVYNKAGLIFANAGVPTITLNGVTGAATFAGTLASPSGTFGTITAGNISGISLSASTITGSTITGNTIQTAASGYRAVMTSANGFLLLANDTWQGSLSTDSFASVVLHSAGNIYLLRQGSQMAHFTADSVDYPGGYKMTFAGGRHIKDTGSAIEFNADIIPDSDEDQDIGYATKKWNNIRAQTLWQQTNTNGSRQVYDFAYIEMNLLPKRMINKRLKGEEGMVMTNGYVPGLELPYKQGTVLKWTSKGLKESSSEKDVAIAIASEKGLPIVLGAEPVRIIGTAKIGDYIVPGNKKGCAIAVNKKNYNGKDKIGVCLKNKKDTKEGLILVMINF